MPCEYSTEGPRARPLGIFWDIENCNIPRGKSAQAVCEKIRSRDFFHGHREIQFAVVCDATKESAVVLDDLHKAQVSEGELVTSFIPVCNLQTDQDTDGP